MKFGMRHISRMFAFAIVLSGGMIPASSNPARTPTPSDSAPAAGQAIARVEVRLRKLHLVRPDLIPYPIMYEVYC